jgi:cysteine desulfurase
VIPIAPLADAARKHGALLICDAAQAVGQLPFTVDGLDACILSGGKWLGGPPASGALWLAPRLRELTLYRGGSPIDPSAGSLEPRGSWDFSGIPGLAAAVTEWNAERRPRRARLLALAARVRDALVRGGVVVLPGESACVTFLVPEPDRTVAALEELDVHVKAVETPEGRAVRVAPDPLADESVAVSRLIAALRTVRVIQTRRVA